MWTLNFPSEITGMGKQKEQLILFLSSDAGISAATVDVSTGKKGKEQSVYAPSGKEGVHPTVLNDASGNFKCLVIRTDATKGERFPKAADKNAMVKLITITADQQLNLTAKELKPAGGGDCLCRRCGKR